ncbi:hypothetical protein ACFQYP_21960 [Nonomuraea antimicrobica]
MPRLRLSACQYVLRPIGGGTGLKVIAMTEMGGPAAGGPPGKAVTGLAG